MALASLFLLISTTGLVSATALPPAPPPPAVPPKRHHEPLVAPQIQADSCNDEQILDGDSGASDLSERWTDRVEVPVHFHAILSTDAPPDRGSVEQMERQYELLRDACK